MKLHDIILLPNKVLFKEFHYNLTFHIKSNFMLAERLGNCLSFKYWHVQDTMVVIRKTQLYTSINN